MAVICIECESQQYLQIVESRFYYDDNMRQIEERHECTMCKSTGKYQCEVRLSDGYSKEEATGGLELTEERPTL